MDYINKKTVNEKSTDDITHVLLTPTISVLKKF